MKNVLEYIVEADYINKILIEEANIEAQQIIGESFNCELLSNLAKEIAKAEKKSNISRAEQRKKYKEQGYSSNYGPKNVNFTFIFAPDISQNRSTRTVKGIKWSEIKDSDFVYVKAGEEKQLRKELKQIYAKGGMGHAIFCTPDTKNPVLFLRGNTDNNELYYFDMNPSHYSNGVRVKNKPYYSYHQRNYNLGETIEETKDLDAYILHITNSMLSSYEDTVKERDEAKSGVINYDKESLAELLKKQKARYKVIVDELKAQKLQSDPTDLLDEIKNINNEITELYYKVINNPDNLDSNFNLGELMEYTMGAYKRLYQSLKYSRDADNEDEKYGAGAGRFSKDQSNEEIRKAKEYIDKVRKKIDDIKPNIK